MVGHPLFGPGPSHGTTDNQPRARPASGTARRARLDLRSDEFKAATELPWPVPFLGDISSRGLFKSYSPSTAPLNRWAWALNSLSVLDLAKIAVVGDGFLSAEGVTIRLGLGVLLGIGGQAPREGGLNAQHGDAEFVSSARRGKRQPSSYRAAADAAASTSRGERTEQVVKCCTHDQTLKRVFCSSR